MALSFLTAAIVSANTDANTTGNTPAKDTTSISAAGGCFILGITSLTATIPATTDIVETGATANTWTLLGSFGVGVAWTCRVFRSQDNPNTGVAHQFKVNKTGAFPAIAVAPVLGEKTSGAFDILTGAGIGVTTSANGGIIIPSQGGEGLLYFIGGGFGSISTSSGYLTKQAESAGDGATKGGISLFTEVQTGYLSRNPAFAYSSQQGAVVGISLRSGAGGTPNPRTKGIDGDIAVGAAASVNFEYTDSWTVELVMSKNGAPASNPAVMETNVANTSAFPGYECFVQSGTNYVTVRIISDFGAGTYLEVHGSTNVCDGLMHYVAWTYDGSHTAAGVQIYVGDTDGTLHTDTMTTVLDALGTNTIIGGTQNMQVGNQTGFLANFSIGNESKPGSVKLVRISNVKRSAAYIAANWTLTTFPPQDANVKLAIPFSEATGTSAGDISGNGNTLTLSSTNDWVGDAATAPAAPTIGTASAVSSTSISVTFTPPTNDGGSPISGYTATTSDSHTGTGSGSPITVAGLTASSVTATVHATNVLGNSAESSASNSVTLGITFDAASNSGYQSATSSLSWSHTWSGSNRMLSVDVAMLSVTNTVTAMTYGGATCTLVGAQSIAGGTGRIEQWRICSGDSGAPGTGANTISVTLSGSLACAGVAVSRTGVHQTSPTESWTGNSGINVGAANATVNVLPVADKTIVHAAIATNDAAATAGQTSRNDVTGAAGSGINEDSGATTISPAASQTMTTAVAALKMWAIAGYAVRPIAAANLGSRLPFRLLFGIGS